MAIDKKPAKSTVLIQTGSSGGSHFAPSNVDTALTNLAATALRSIGAGGTIAMTDDDPKPVLKSTGLIDVARNFSWYAGPAMGESFNPVTGKVTHAIDKIPCAFVQEREQLLSSLVSGAMYYLDAAKRIVAGSSYHKESISSLVGQINDMIGNTQGGLDRMQDIAILEANNLNSLKGIYFTRDTGFNYRFPIYGEGLNKTQAPVWDSANTDSGSISKTVAATGQKIIRNVAEVVNLGQPGVYIEEPKYFQGAEQGESRTISFPLSNTVRRGTISPIQQNYELLWLLSFQNKPYKTSFSRTPPPKIYQVVVPGQFSFPYAYISNMNVEFVGTTRNTWVQTPVGKPSENGGGIIKSKAIQTPVPEAYVVSLTFTSLIGSYANTLLGDSYNTAIQDGVIKVGSTRK